MIKRGRTPVEEAARLLCACVKHTCAAERIPLEAAVGRVCMQDIFAAVCQPPFSRSPLDGYAARSADIAQASSAKPAVLPVSLHLYAGSTPAPLAPGTAARVMTGAPVPEGADCVVAQEQTDCGQKTVSIYKSVSGGANICLRGEDFQAGEPLTRRGQRLDFARIGLLAGQRIASVEVSKKPRVAVLSTGDELTGAGLPLAPGKIYDSNCAMLCARLAELGAQAFPLSPCADDLDALCARISQALPSCDFLITTGGVSVGERDLMPEAVQRAGGNILFYGIAAKPGSPALGAEIAGKPVLCLSGNPFAALATFEMLARPVLHRLSGKAGEAFVRRCARLETGFPKPSDLRRFVRARYNGETVVPPAAGHSSGGIGSLAGCNCLIDIPAGSPPLAPGDKVEVLLL